MKHLRAVTRMIMLSEKQLQTAEKCPKVDGRTEFRGELPRVDDPIKVDLKKLRTKLTDLDIVKVLEEKDVETSYITQEVRPNGSVFAYDPKNNDMVAVKNASGEIIEFLTIWMVRERNVRLGFSCAINLSADHRPSSLNDSPEKRLMNGREKFF